MSENNKYVKKQIVIEAEEYKDESILEFTDGDANINYTGKLCIDTLEGVMSCNKGDYVIKGINGEFYPIRRDIFLNSYEHYKPEEQREIKEFLPKHCKHRTVTALETITYTVASITYKGEEYRLPKQEYTHLEWDSVIIMEGLNALFLYNKTDNEIYVWEIYKNDSFLDGLTNNDLKQLTDKLGWTSYIIDNYYHDYDESLLRIRKK